MKKTSLRDLDFRRLSEKAGFTWTETRVLLFLVFSILTGYIYLSVTSEKENPYKKYNYAKEDSLFFLSYSSELENNEPDHSYRNEIFPGDTIKKEPRVKKTIPQGNSININSASLEQLMQLPGVGQKTAESIIDFRKKNGNFKSIGDIMNVKGIKEGKLNKIKPYIFVK